MKLKKQLAVGGGAVICIGLLVAISLQLGKAPKGEDVLPMDSPTSSEVVTDPITPATGSTESTTEEKKPVIQPGTDTTMDNLETSQPVDTRPAQTDETEQSIQSEPKKPEAPEPPKTSDGIDRTPSDDKNHEFTSESPDTPPDYMPEDIEKKPTPSESKPQNSGGLPGFDYVPDGGANQGEHLDDMYENGNKIGSMD